MIPEKEYPEIVKGLLEKTRQGNVNWKERPDLQNKTSYRLLLPSGIRIELNYHTPETDPNYFELKLLNKDGKTVGSWVVSEDDDGSHILEELYSEIAKRLTDWEKVLEDVKKFVGK